MKTVWIGVAVALAVLAPREAGAQGTCSGGQCERVYGPDQQPIGSACVNPAPNGAQHLCLATVDRCRLVICPDGMAMSELGRPLGTYASACAGGPAKRERLPIKDGDRLAGPARAQRVSSPASRTNSLPVT